MCGRFTLTLTPAEIQQSFELTEIQPELQPRFNIAPSQHLAVVTDGKIRNLELMKWGLVPSWAKDVTIGNRLINARSETLAEKPSFRNAFARRRCLILADGFYEWQRKGENRSGSIPHYIRMKNGNPFAFAGLWESWKSPKGEEIRTCVIITTTPNELVAQIHDRMPVIFDTSTCWLWLQPNPVPVLQNMLVPFDQKRMEEYPVGRTVNDPTCDTLDCIKPA
jgi:putative SOS response-associated peptidase YedK